MVKKAKTGSQKEKAASISLVPFVHKGRAARRKDASFLIDGAVEVSDSIF